MVEQAKGTDSYNDVTEDGVLFSVFSWYLVFLKEGWDFYPGPLFFPVRRHRTSHALLSAEQFFCT